MEELTKRGFTKLSVLILKKKLINIKSEEGTVKHQKGPEECCLEHGLLYQKEKEPETDL